MTALRKLLEIYRKEGGVNLVKKSFKYAYNEYVCPWLPKRQATYNGVTVRAAHLGDQILPWQETNVPGYEEALVRGIRQHVTEGSRVVVVGGGWGVTTVAAARQTGPQGQVLTYEGSLEEVEKVTRTIDLNGVDGHASVKHAVVGEAISLRGSQGNASIVAPDELPECDTLVLDCEGAEIEILNNMDIRPETILVETHGMYGAPREDVSVALNEVGYDVFASTVAEERVRDFCEEKGIYVLMAERK